VKEPLTVAITGASSATAYALLPHLCSGQTFGPDQPIVLHLLEQKHLAQQEALRGIEMELQDSLHHLVHGITITTDEEAAFHDADVIIMLQYSGTGEDKADNIAGNAALFARQGGIINKKAASTARVLVAGPSANTNCLIVTTYAPDVPVENFTALSREEHNRALAQVAAKAEAPVEAVSNVIVWGSSGGGAHADVKHCKVGGKAATEAIDDASTWSSDFFRSVQARGTGIFAAKKASSALCIAQAISDHLHDWMLGTPPGRFVSMTVESTGNPYGVAEGLFYSFPCSCNGGSWTIVEGLSGDDETRARLRQTENELLDEKNLALDSIKALEEEPQG